MVPKSIHEKVSPQIPLTHLSIALIFDLDNTLVKSAYKKHKLSDYD
jgi:predicted HAD superfamily phosphohydrolase YqeG